MNGKSIYIAATDQHIGKTTTTLGLLATLKHKGINVGYCKPVGQKWVHWSGKRVDKDAALFADTMGFEVEPDIHSPVIVESGFTAKYVENPQKEQLRNALINAANKLHRRHDLVVHEGTGHPGVGAVIDHSNADVAKLLGSGVILVAKGGIGRTVDRLLLCKRYFDYINVPVLGVIINKVVPEKMEKISRILHKRLAKENIEILGMLPFVAELAYPMISTVVRQVKGTVICGQNNLNSIVQGTIAGSLIDLESLDTDKQYLLVVSIRRLNDALAKLQKIWEHQQMLPNLAGVILTGDAPLKPEDFDYLSGHDIPAFKTNYDTYESIIKLSHLEVKINTRTPHKIRRAIELFKQHVDVDRITRLLGV